MPDANSTKVGVVLFVSCVFFATTRKISSIIVGLKEDEDVTFLNPRVPHAPPAAVIGRSAGVNGVLGAQLAIHPNSPDSLQAPLAITLSTTARDKAGSSDSSESVDQVSDLVSEGCSTESIAFRIRKHDVYQLSLTYYMQIVESSAGFDSLMGCSCAGLSFADLLVAGTEFERWAQARVEEWHPTTARLEKTVLLQIPGSNAQVKMRVVAQLPDPNEASSCDYVFTIFLSNPVLMKKNGGALANASRLPRLPRLSL